MSKIQVKKINREPIPDIPSFMFFVFQKQKESDRNTFIVIDGNKKVIKNILNDHKCKYIDRKHRIVNCKNVYSSTLLSKLQYFQNKRLLKFAYIPSYNFAQKTSQISDISDKAKVYVGNSKKGIKIQIPSVNSKYSKSPIKLKKGDSVKISANTVDDVARVAKLLGVKLCTFEDGKSRFIGIHEKQ